MREALARLYWFVLGYVRARWLRRFRDRATLERWQDREVRRHLAWVAKHSPFYAARFRGRSLDAWATFPTIDKASMMASFTALNTAGVPRHRAEAIAIQAERDRDFASTIGDVTVGLSSGTSGNRGLFLVRPHERNGWAGTLLAKILPEPLWRPQRMALFLRANSRLYESVGGRRFRFAFFDLFRPLDELAREVEAFDPTLLVAPASVLRVLAERRARGELRLAPARIISVAEVLDPLDRKVIEAAFGQPVHQVYQCTEGFLAATCEHATLHLNEDLVAIQPEWLDEAQTRFVPIVTDFTRTTQPIVRYRLNDVLVAKKEPCPCGSAFRAIERIEGRSDDVLQGASDHGPVPIFADLLTRKVISASDAIEEYAIVQTGPEDLHVSLRVRSAVRADVEQRIERDLRAVFVDLGARAPRVRFTDRLPQVGPTKLRRVRRTAFAAPSEVAR